MVVTAVFFAFGIGLGLWAGAIPALMVQAGLGTAGLGVALTLNAGAYVGAMAAGGQLARVVAPCRLIVAALLANAVTFPVLFTVASPLALMLALTAMGLGTGLLDLAMNTEGAAVERDLGRKVLLSMHAAGSAAQSAGRGVVRGVTLLGIVLGGVHRRGGDGGLARFFAPPRPVKTPHGRRAPA